MPLVGRQMFRKVTVVGVGLIGGSFALAVKKHRLAREVVGLSQRQTTLQTALKMKVIDQAYQDVKKAVNNADLVVLSTPVSIILGMLSMIGPHLKRSCIVTDVGSAKMAIVNAAAEHLPNPSLFVGSHPMAGSEKRGVQNAYPELFENSMCLMTPTKATNRSAVDRVRKLWTKLGAKVKIMSPEDHDKALAYVSHLPHVLAYGLMGAVPNEFLSYAAQGFKDTTRIASSSPQMWNDICMGNSRNIINGLDAVVQNLSALRRAIVMNDSRTLTHQFKTAKTKRDKIG